MLFLGILVLAVALIWTAETWAGMNDELHLGNVMVVGIGLYLVLRWRYACGCRA